LGKLEEGEMVEREMGHKKDKRKERTVLSHLRAVKITEL
jgi:hypothetical protein